MALTILLVEDDNQVRAFVYGILWRAGYQVVDAACGEYALRLAYEHEIDCLLTDVELPGMSGTELARSLPRSIAVVFMTGGGTEDIGRSGIDYAAVLRKPFRPGELVSLLSELSQEVPVR